jgi:hypothetical protein
MSRADLDLKASAAVALVAVLVATTIDTAVVRTVPSLLLLLFVPGYVLSVVLFPARRDLLERSLLAVGLSLCVDVLGALLLDRLGVGLTARSWSIGLALFTLAACFAAHRRRATVPATAPEDGGPTRAAAVFRGRRSLVTAAMLVGSLAAVVAALVVARLPAGSAHVEGYSALWIRPVDQSAGTFSVGVLSQELRTMRFRVVALSLAGPKVVFRRDLTLRPGQEWTARARVVIPRGGATQVRVSLYKAVRLKTAYRQVYATFGSAAP